MAKLEFSGPLRHRLRSFLALNRIAISVYARHLFARRIAPDWSAEMEIGILFWRHQFTRAMAQSDMRTGRDIFNSLLTLTDDTYEITQHPYSAPNGHWFIPKTRTTNKVLLYFHGGGYTFDGPVSTRFGAMLAHHTGARVFMPRYRLTPEHPHPAQAQDARSAWDFLRHSHDAQNLIVIGDSAGGHMALTLIKDLKGRDQPALCIALCPWTDIGKRGDSMQSNNHYDLVQGWMAIRFGQWLNPNATYPHEDLSPIHWDFSGLAPIYIQVGGREMLRDMITDFAHAQTEGGASVLMDLWADMPHDFQAYDSFQASSIQALARLRDIVHSLDQGSPHLQPLPQVTQVAAGCFSTGG